jgi:hypothetical protein
MRRLDVVRVIVPPGCAHALGFDVVGDNFIAVNEGPIANSTVPFLRDDLPREKFSEFRGGTQLPVPSRMVWVVDSLD